MILMTNYVSLSDEEMAERYKLLKDNERIRNKTFYNNMKINNPEKYKERLIKNRQYIEKYLDDIKKR